MTVWTNGKPRQVKDACGDSFASACRVPDFERPRDQEQRAADEAGQKDTRRPQGWTWSAG
jgi:hypothetical protein